MSFGKDSSIVFIMDGDKLVDVARCDTTADKQPLDIIELEVMRIVKEYNRQDKRIKELEERNNKYKKRLVKDTEERLTQFFNKDNKQMADGTGTGDREGGKNNAS